MEEYLLRLDVSHHVGLLRKMFAAWPVHVLHDTNKVVCGPFAVGYGMFHDMRHELLRILESLCAGGLWAGDGPIFFHFAFPLWSNGIRHSSRRIGARVTTTTTATGLRLSLKDQHTMGRQ